MNYNVTENQKLLGASIHLAVLTKYVIPFGNFLIPTVLWALNKDNDFINAQGKNAINFQLSILVYTLILGLITVLGILLFADNIFIFLQQLDTNNFYFSPSYTFSFTAIGVFIFSILSLFLLLFVFELYAVIRAAICASKGEVYAYPLCISFIQNKNTNTIATKPILK